MPKHEHTSACVGFDSNRNKWICEMTREELLEIAREFGETIQRQQESAQYLRDLDALRPARPTSFFEWIFGR